MAFGSVRRVACIAGLTLSLPTACSLIGTDGLRNDEGGAGSASTGATDTTQQAVSTTSSGGNTCGDGVAREGEACDGNDFGGKSCLDEGYAESAGVSCTSRCEISYAECASVCGNEILEPGEVCDGGFDCSDVCDIPVANTCVTAVPIMMPLGRIEITSALFGASTEPTTDKCGATPGPERIYALTSSIDGFVTAWFDASETSIDPVLSIRGSNCANRGTEEECSAVVGARDVISVRLEANQTRYLFVDSASLVGGAFKLVLDLSTGEDCNDPIPIPIDMTASYILDGVRGSTLDLQNDGAGSCGGQRADIVYAFENAPGTPADLSFLVQAFPGSWSPVVYLRSTCEAGELDCDGQTPFQSTASSEPSPLFLWVDGQLSGFGAGTFDLRITVN